MSGPIEVNNKNHVIEDQLDNQLVLLDTLLADPNCPYTSVLEQAFKVFVLVSQLLKKRDEEYVHETEQRFWVNVKEQQGTYNTWSVVALNLVSSGLTIGGGFVGLGVATLDAGALKSQLEGVGTAMGGIGRGTGGFGELFKNNNDGKRAFTQASSDEQKRKLGERSSSAQGNKQQVQNAKQQLHQMMQSLHSAAQAILNNR